MMFQEQMKLLKCSVLKLPYMMASAQYKFGAVTQVYPSLFSYGSNLQ